MSDRSAGLAPSRVTAVLGPTNTGKTHLAVERMLGHASGMIGLPLRLLAREIYERIVRLRGAAAVALITGEEKIVPTRPHYFVCTVEAMPLERSVEFLAIDEIQLVADPERGHVFTQRLLHARGRFETMFLGAGTMEPLIRRLVPDVEIVTRDRLSTLSYAGSKKLTRLPRRSAIVAFSTDRVYAIAELIRRQRGGAAVVMGSLSPRTRNAQVALYQSGEVDFLVATDAIGMGLNMDVDHVAFAGLRKFDGRRTRWLHAHEIGQIAGRAGRHLRDGTFGVTAEAEDLDADLGRTGGRASVRSGRGGGMEKRPAGLRHPARPAAVADGDAPAFGPQPDGRGPGRDPAASPDQGRGDRPHRSVARGHHAAVGGVSAAGLPEDDAG